MKKFIILCAAIATQFSLSLANADGNETLGPPSISIASGTDFVVAGTGMTEQPETINLSIPQGATVEQVLLYWEGFGEDEQSTDSTIEVNGNPVEGTLIGGPDFFYSKAFSSTYRADITGLNLVGSGDNVLVLSEMSFNRVNNGAGIIAVIDDGSGASELILRDGNDLAYAFFPEPRRSTVLQTYNFEPSDVDRVAEISMFFGGVAGTFSTGGPVRPTRIDVTVGSTISQFTNELNGNSGEEWDTLVVNVDVPAGETSLTVQAISPRDVGRDPNPASFVWIAGAVSIPQPDDCTGTIGDFVWVDENRNGQQDTGEPGIDGVTVNITDGAGFSDSTTTASDGSYSFTGLDCGVTYTVSVINPDSTTYQNAQVNVGDDTTDSDNHDGATATPTTANPTDNTVDFGYELIPASLGDFVWLDENQNGRQDAGEPGLAGVTVVLKDCQLNIIDQTTTGNGTDNPLGYYQFDDLNPGEYIVMVMEPAGYMFTDKDVGENPGDPDLAFDSDVNTATGNTDCITLAPGENNIDVDAGLYQGAGLGNYVWEDLNANGIQDDGNTGIFGVEVVLLDCDMVPTGDTTFTDVDGLYSFNDLAAGCYIVMFNRPAGFDAASPLLQGAFDTDSDADPVTGKTDEIQLADGQFDPDWDAGFYKTATLGDRVWHDVNLNGLQDDGEPGLNGCSVTLQDANGNQVGAIETTAGDGNYLFTGLEPGEYMVQFDNNCPDNWVYTLQDVDNPASDAIDSDANTAGKTAKYILVSGDENLTVDAGRHEAAAPGISIEKATSGTENDPNADDADLPTGPFIPFEDAVYWTYVVTNTGNRDLTNVVVTDDNGTPGDETDDFLVVCDKTALIVNDSTTCTASNPNPDFKGQYNNVGKVTALDPDDDPVLDQDPSHYFGADPSIDIVKTTRLASEGVNTGTDDIEVAAGSDIAWDYLITNDGNVNLINVELSDNELLLLDPVPCPSDMLTANGGSMTCTVTGFKAIAGDYDNVGTVVGTPADDDNVASGLPRVSDFDPSNYFGGAVELAIDKTTRLASEAPGSGDDGLNIPARSAIAWDYVVTNNSNVQLTNVSVTDDKGVTVSCPANELAAGGSFTCTATGTAVAGSYRNIGTVTATGPAGVGDPAPASDPSNYFGGVVELAIDKTTRLASDPMGSGADDLNIPAPSAIAWDYVVTNNSNVDLTNVSVTDDQGVTVSCPATELAAGGSFTCTATGTAVAGSYRNIGTVTATGPAGVGDPAPASDPSNYFGGVVELAIDKTTRLASDPMGSGADGLNIPARSAIAWDYVVTNNSNVDLTNVSVTDDQGVTVSCPAAPLAAGASFTCTATGTAIAGSYNNIGTVTATGPAGIGDPAPASDPSDYFGTTAPAISLVKVTVDGDVEGDALRIAQGTTIAWKYTVKNIGDVELENLILIDNKEGRISCGQDTLAVDEEIECVRFGGIAVAGEYANSAEVCGADATGTTPGEVCAIDTSSYFGEAVCDLTLNKMCFVTPPPPSSEFFCDKPIDSLTMIWDGAEETVWVRAWKGSVGSTSLGVQSVSKGDAVTFTGFAGSPNDVFWEVYSDAGLNNKIGESKFHLSCSDDDMDGETDTSAFPNDCGKFQGNGKDNTSSLLNLWKLEGMVDAKNTLDCTVDTTPVFAEACEFVKEPAASCETEDKPKSLTFRYTPSDCSTTNPQEGKYSCAGGMLSGDATFSLIADENKYTYVPADGVLEPGDLITITATGNDFESNFEFQLQGDTTTQTYDIHASCSKALAVGDVFGSFELVGFNGKTGGQEVQYAYEVTNKSSGTVTGITISDDKLDVPGSIASLEPGESDMLTASAFLDMTLTNTATASGFLVSSACESNADSVTVMAVEPPKSCETNGKPTALEFTLGSGNCADTSNTQDGKAKCTGGGILLDIQSVSMTKDADKYDINVVGDTFSIAYNDKVGERMASTIKFRVTDSNGTTHDYELHTSCSQPLAEGDVFGGLELTGYVPVL